MQDKVRMNRRKSIYYYGRYKIKIMRYGETYHAPYLYIKKKLWGFQYWSHVTCGRPSLGYSHMRPDAVERWIEETVNEHEGYIKDWGCQGH